MNDSNFGSDSYCTLRERKGKKVIGVRLDVLLFFVYVLQNKYIYI